MRIAHICLSCFYLDDQSYQENELVKCHVDQGHEVVVIASTDTRSKLGEIVYCEPGSYRGSDGADVIRLAYRKIFPHIIACKIRAHPGVDRLLRHFKPDVILFHGACGYELITVARYVRRNPGVFFYIDSHEDANNSARNFISREILHKLFYRFCLQKALPSARKVLAISTETIDFLKKTYAVPAERIEFFPLGGAILSDASYLELRTQGRARFGLAPHEVVFVQAGKQTVAKKLIESLKAFACAPPQAKLYIAGSIDPEIDVQATALISANPNVHFLGWKNPDEMRELLCLADVYLQPGTQSVTMQNSLCCRCVPIIADVPSHRVYVDKNGWLVTGNIELEAAIRAACGADLAAMSVMSIAVARQLLDYSHLSRRVLHG